jgi:hypothetical protein
MFDKIKQICVTAKSKVTNGFGAVSAIGAASVMAAGSAYADTTTTGLVVDYSTLTSSITSQLGPALVAALGIAGAILGVKYGFRFFRSFSKG